MRLQWEVSTALELAVRTEEESPGPDPTSSRWASPLLVQLEPLRHVGQAP